MGGIVPDSRKQKVAQKSAVAQEEWVKSQGYTVSLLKLGTT
jgi:hypothetical protein